MADHVAVPGGSGNSYGKAVSEPVRLYQEIIYNVQTGEESVKYFDGEGSEIPAPDDVLQAEAVRLAATMVLAKDPREVAVRFQRLLLAELDRRGGANASNAA